jgi:hypothetical protein
MSSDINLVQHSASLDNSGLVAFINSTYNTGWMNGDIKLATLSDTDDIDLVGTELVTNTDDANFTADTGNWSLGANFSISGGELVATNTAVNAVAYLTITGLTAGKKYVFTVENTGITSGSFNMYYRDGATFVANKLIQPNQTTSLTFTAGNIGDDLFYIYSLSNGSNGTFSNVSVRLAEPDRSVNNNGLQVFGTVQKNPVATGADLVAYSGFSPSNYLEQPYNSDLDFGTGDFCVMGWTNNFTSNCTILYTGTTSSDGINIWGYNDILKTKIGEVYTEASYDTGNNFTFFTVTRKAGVVYVYINGELKNTKTSTGAINYNGFKVGTGFYTGSSPSFKSALLRISATAPTAEQIKKIYEDEKVLFQENAKATLHGTSDAVTALAYDDTTELLHVGTSAGRSVFQGLRRVDNTTDAVGVAISASNNLVVEE